MRFGDPTGMSEKEQIAVGKIPGISAGSTDRPGDVEDGGENFEEAQYKYVDGESAYLGLLPDHFAVQ